MVRASGSREATCAPFGQGAPTLHAVIAAGGSQVRLDRGIGDHVPSLIALTMERRPWVEGRILDSRLTCEHGPKRLEADIRVEPCEELPEASHGCDGERSCRAFQLCGVQSRFLCEFHDDRSGVDEPSAQPWNIDEVKCRQLGSGHPDTAGRRLHLDSREFVDARACDKVQANPAEIALRERGTHHDLEHLRSLVRRSVKLGSREPAHVVVSPPETASV